MHKRSSADQNSPSTSSRSAVLLCLGTALVWALVALPLFVAIWYVNAYAVNVPVLDQWHCVDVLKDLRNGETSWLHVFLTPHAKHMSGIQFLLMATLAPLTGYDIRMEAFVGMAILPVAFAALACMARERLPGGIWAVAGLVPLSWLMFSLRQNESFLGGACGGLGAFAVPALLVLTIFLLERVRAVGWTLLLAMLIGTCCAFTLFDGLLVLPLGAVVLASNALVLDRNGRTGAWWAVAVWSVFSGVIAGVNFLNNYKLQPSVGNYVAHSTQASAKYVVTVLGSPFCELGATGAAFAVGCALLALLAIFAIVVARTPNALDRRMIVPALLVLFAGFTAWLIAMARGHDGVDPTTSRYVSHCYLGIVGLYLLFLSAPRVPAFARRSLLTVLVAMIGVGSVVATRDGLKCGPIRRDEHLIAANVLRTYRLRQESQALTKFAAVPPEKVKRLAPFLEQNRFTVFREERKPQNSWNPDPVPVVHLDGLNNLPGNYANGSFTFFIDGQTDRDIVITGWAVDRESRGPVGGVIACLDGDVEIPMAYGLDRPDAATLMGKRSYRSSGFWTCFGTSMVGKGSHTVSFKVISPDKQGFYEAGSRLVLKGGKQI